MPNRAKPLLITGLILVALYALAGFFLVPRIVSSQLLKRLPEALERPVALEGVAFNPFSLTLRLAGLDIREADGGAFIAFDELRINLQAASLLREGIILKELVLTAPRIAIRRNQDNALNFEDLLTRPAGEATEATGAPGGMPAIRIDRLAVVHGAVEFDDLYPESPFATVMRDINFTITNFTTLPGEAGQFRFAAAPGSAESISLSGQVGLNPVAVEGRVEVDQLNLPAFMPYIEGQFNGIVHSGRLTTSFGYRFALEANGPEAGVFDGALAIAQLNLVAGDGIAPLAGVESLAIAGFSADLDARSAAADAIRLDGAHIMAHRRADGSLNLAALVPARDAQAGDPADGPPAGGAPWTLSVPSIRVADLSLLVLDESTAVVGDLEVVVTSLELDGFTTAPGRPFNIAAQLENTPAGGAGITGQATLAPLSADLAVRLADWDLAPLSPYIGELANVGLRAGSLSLDLRVRFNTDAAGAPELALGGEAGLSGLDLREPESGDQLAGWDALAVRGIEFAYPPARLAIAEVEQIGPQAEFALFEDGTDSVSRILRRPAGGDPEGAEAGTDEPAGEAVESVPMPLEIGAWKVSGGAILFRDNRQTPAVMLAVDELSASAAGLSSDLSARPQVDISARVARTATVNLRGSLNLLAAQPFADLEIGMNGLDLAVLGPYFSRYAGYRLDRGALDLDLHYQIEEQQLQAENRVLINQLGLGARTDSPDATGLPVRLAVALLRDPAGNIRVDLPVRGNLGDPEFRFGRVVASVITNLIARIATSPFSLLGGLVGAPAEDLERVLFAPGAADLDDKARRGLDALSRAMLERPGIAIEVSAPIDPAVESAALQRERMREVLAQRLQIGIGLPQPEAYRMRVARAYQLQFPEPQDSADEPVKAPAFEEMEARLLEAFPVDESELRQLALRRQQAVRDYLVAKPGIQPERVLTTQADGSPLAASGLSEARIEIR